MRGPLDEALRRLENALDLLDAAVDRRLETERRRGDLETELQLMQDDRARLAVELDATVARLHQVEAAADDVERRVQRAIGAVRDALTAAESQGAV